MAKAATAPAGAFFANWRQNIIYIGFAVIFVVFALTLNDKGFLNPNNLLNIVRQTAMIAVMGPRSRYSGRPMTRAPPMPASAQPLARSAVNSGRPVS